MANDYEYKKYLLCTKQGKLTENYMYTVIKENHWQVVVEDEFLGGFVIITKQEVAEETKPIDPVLFNEYYEVYWHMEDSEEQRAKLDELFDKM